MIRLEDVLKTSAKRLEDALKMSCRHFCKKSWRRLENVLKTSWQDVLKTSWRRMAKMNILVLTKTSSEDARLGWIYLSWSRLLLKTKDVFKTSSSRQMFAGMSPCWFTYLSFKLALVIRLISDTTALSCIQHLQKNVREWNYWELVFCK